MNPSYELIGVRKASPAKVSIQSVGTVKMHWHAEAEIILVLEGSIRIREKNKVYLLEENDLMLINGHSTHSLIKTEEDNILLSVQVNLEYIQPHYPEIMELRFECRSFESDGKDQELFDGLRYYLAQLVWHMNKNQGSNNLINVIITYQIADYIFKNCNYYRVDDIRENNDIDRLGKIINYINNNFEKGVTLQEIADQENLSAPYLSRLFKKKVGITFQEYVNNIRIDRAVALLYKTNRTITEIAYASGFPSTKAFYKRFRDQKGSTPTEFREEFSAPEHILEDKYLENKPDRTYLDVNRSKALEKLFCYLGPDKITAANGHIESVVKSQIEIDGQKEGLSYEPYWKKLTTFSRAVEGLRHNWQLQLKELQREIKFEYIRFHGIFCDEMMICNLDEKGNIIYNWFYVDQLFDTFKKEKIKPYIELGFMPSELKSSDETMFWWKANMSRPRDMKLWNDLVRAFIKHCINRYGLKEVETWYFEVWNEPDFEYVFWIGDREDYFEFYKETFQAVKSVSKNLKVGGPAILQQAVSGDTWLEDFLSYCKKNYIHLDFISLHIYPEIYDEEHGAQSLGKELEQGASMEEMIQKLATMKRIYNGKNHTYDAIKEGNRIIGKMLSYRPEVHITEWNASAYNRNLIHDTSFVASYIIHNVIKCLGQVDALGYWTFTDIQEETKAGISAFHGGFGLINQDGLKKASYYAYYLLSKLGKKIIDQGDGYVVTKTDDHLQILVCNYVYFDNLFLNGDTSALTHENRYRVFEDKPMKEIGINIKGLVGHYKISTYKLNRDHGSVYDRWVAMGAPENMTKEEISYLQGISYPKMEVKDQELQGNYRARLMIPPHGVGLIVLEKQV